MADNAQNNISQEYTSASVGLNMDNVPSQIGKGQLSYALNAVLENFDDNSVNYQNELGNELCLTFPDEFVLIGHHFIPERDKHIFFLTNPKTKDSEIGYMVNNDCEYRTLINASCLKFDVHYPIHKVVHRITNCSTEIYWTDGLNPRRYLDIDNLPYTLASGSILCDPVYNEGDLDCNQLNVQPDFDIPIVKIADVTNTGDLKAGTYQFAVQYADAQGNPYTSYYSITNPVPIGDPSIVTPNFDYPVGRSIIVDISNLDITGLYHYYNLAVVKTVNAISSVELVGTYFIENSSTQIIYTGQNVTQIRLSMDDIMEKFPYYEIAQDLTSAQDVLIWDNLSSIDRVNYQKIASQIHLQWETWRIPATENYADGDNAANYRGYLRDEVYPFEIQFLLRNGKETDGFHIPGREMTLLEASRPPIPNTDPDFVGSGTSAPYWKIYNTATATPGYCPGYVALPNYKGPYKYGEFAYWESTEEYPCNTELWGDLAGKKIRHHKFPDVAVSPIFESLIFYDADSMVMGNEAIFPIGVKVDVNNIKNLIVTSDLLPEQKDEIVGFRILRGNRATNSSIVGKGILRNVNKYEGEGKDYYFANYPYNDLHEDPFINSTNNAFAEECDVFDVNITALSDGPEKVFKYAKIQYTSCETGKTVIEYSCNVDDNLHVGLNMRCAVGKPTILIGEGTVAYTNYDKYSVRVKGIRAGFAYQYNDRTYGITEKWISQDDNTVKVEVVQGTGVACVRHCKGDKEEIIFLGSVNVVDKEDFCGKVEPLDPPVIDDGDKLIFNSPETSFGQPFLGDILKLESTIYGRGKAHFTEVLDNAKYKLLSREAQIDALGSSVEIASITTDLNTEAMMMAYQSYLEIYLNGITRKNYAYSFNSIASYDYSTAVQNGLQIKQRNIDKTRYLIPAVTAIDGVNINNWYRESSVYIKTSGSTPLPFPTISGVEDNSRFTISGKENCSNPGELEDIDVVAYYASMKKEFINQWGQMYSYNTIDTGYVHDFDPPITPVDDVVFGGDTYICRFAFKTKLPFFIDNRVGAPDDSDIFYDEIGNVGYPAYWHSARSILEDYTVYPAKEKTDTSLGILTNFVSYKAHNFDCSNDTTIATGAARTFYDGYFYLFAYGVPNFYCETSYNLDLRQAYNTKEGDFWPHVSSDIPDDWVQEKKVSIANDNTYYYNSTFSKQNVENYFPHLPADWNEEMCYTHYPFRAIYSDVQIVDADNRVNSWRIYRAISYFDFPQNYGDLTSLDGIQNRAVLARFHNKTLLYNSLLTIDTSNPQAAYIGNQQMFKGSPPVDFAETDLGYVGSQHKFMLKIPHGQVTIDAKRGHVFLIQGTNAIDISGFGSGMNRFFTDHLPFQILNHFPEYDVDNHYNGVGLHGVYDAKFERVIITKIDYAPLVEGITYTDHKFYLDRREITLEDTDYFCNRSWTVSYNMNTKSWISFHSYIPNFYIGENNFFYSGLNGCCDEFDFIAQTTPITTTSSTTYSPVITTTSSTTREDTSCDIIGEVIEIDEDITTTTTSTICIRPSGLINVDLIIGYMNDGRPVGSTATEDLACGAMTFIMENPLTVTLTLSAYSDGNYIVGTVFYADNGTDDCSCIPNGWYFSTKSMEYCWIFHVVDCEIVEMVDCCLTTTTTTTAAPTTTTTTTCPDCVEYLIENIGNIEDPVLFNVTICNGASLVKEVYYDLDQISCCEPDSVVAQTPEDSRISMIGCCYMAPTTTTSTSTAEVTTTTTTQEPTTTTTTTDEVTTTTTTTSESTTTTTTTGEVTTTTTTTDGGETTTTTTTVEDTTTTTTTVDEPTTTTTTTNEVSTTTTTTVEEPTTTTTTTVESTTTTTTEEITTTTTTTEETCLRNEYGFLYNYYAVVDERNIAPEGWRVPTEADFDILIASAGGEVNGGLHLKSSDSDFWGVAGDNSTGFGAVGGGVRSGYNGSYIWRNAFGYYHSSDFIMNGGTPYNIILDLSSNTSHAYTTAISAMNYGLSVRLIKEDDVDEGYMCDNDDNRYPTVKIGNQVWMAQNLVTTKYRNGESISGPLFTDVQWVNVAGEAYCSYFDNELCDAFDRCTTTTTTTLPCDLSIEIIDVDYNPTTTTTTTLCHVAAELIDIICEDITTTTTTTIESTTTTTTTTLLCEPMICDTTLTVGTDGDGNYGFLRGFAGSISPDCGSVNVVVYIDSQGLLGVVLIDYVCDVTLWINGVEYELTYLGYIPEYGGNAYFIPLVPNPFPSIGETCNVAICGTECTTTTTTTCDPSKCDYGLLYNFFAVNTGKLAPTGWHVPTDAEWTTLSTYLGGEEVAGGKLKSIETGPCDWIAPNEGATNESGFSGLPGGFRDSNGDFSNIGYHGMWWSSSEGSTHGAWLRSLGYNRTIVFRYDYYKAYGFSVRCVRDTYEGWENDVPVVDYDGNEYDVVEIGTQLWLVQNLKVTHYNDGEAIPNVTDGTTWSNLTTGALCAYNNDWETYACVDEPTTTTTTTTVEPTTTTTTTTLSPTTSTTTSSTTTSTTTMEPTTTTTTTCDPLLCDYGLLYNWYAVNTGKLAPTGWHVPTDTEWATLTTWLTDNGYGYEGSGTDIGKSVASQCGWKTYSTPGTPGNDQSSNNSSGFSGFPGGSRYSEGYFGFIGYQCYWWSSTELSTDTAWSWYLGYSSTVVNRGFNNNEGGCSVRCLRDNSTGWTPSEKMQDIDGNQYDTIQLGTQIWTIQNLKTVHYNDGGVIPNIEDNTAWSNLTTGALCAYNNDWETYVCVPEPTTTTTTTVAPTTTTTSTTVESTTTTTTTTTII